MRYANVIATSSMYFGVILLGLPAFFVNFRTRTKTAIQTKSSAGVHAQNVCNSCHYLAVNSTNQHFFVNLNLHPS